MKRLLPLALPLLFSACITLEEPALSPQAAGKGQRTILLVYASPGPWVITESESKAEAAAKTLPMFSFVVQSLQDEHRLAASKDLQQYIPPWKPGELLETALSTALPQAKFPGRFLSAADTEANPASLRDLNRAADTLEWQNKYFYEDPEHPRPRDYARILEWDDALAFEVNLLPYLAADDDGNMIPSLGASTKLYRCQTMRLLWKHEDKVEDKTGARTLYEFKTLPAQLVDRWKALIPAMATQISSSLHSALYPSISSGTVPATALSSSTAMAAPPAATQVSSGTTLAPALSSATVPAAAAALSSPTAAAPIAPVVSSGTLPAAEPTSPSSATTPSPPIPAPSESRSGPGPH